ncbi:MAG TPA: hypothetical protein VLG50_00905 [Candidatus Saccharimonadales bacterium]|nr:hypothetical protein [Candidatus Saccharimonadales bacterium]
MNKIVVLLSLCVYGMTYTSAGEIRARQLIFHNQPYILEQPDDFSNGTQIRREPSDNGEEMVTGAQLQERTQSPVIPTQNNGVNTSPEIRMQRQSPLNLQQHPSFSLTFPPRNQLAPNNPETPVDPENSDIVTKILCCSKKTCCITSCACALIALGVGTVLLLTDAVNVSHPISTMEPMIPSGHPPVTHPTAPTLTEPTQTVAPHASELPPTTPPLAPPVTEPTTTAHTIAPVASELPPTTPPLAPPVTEPTTTQHTP